jgi:hypothetical protein
MHFSSDTTMYSMSYKKRAIRQYRIIETPVCRHTIVTNTIAEVTGVGAGIYERVKLRVTCDLENVNLTDALTQANKTIMNVLTYALLPAFFWPLLRLEGPPSEFRPITFRFPFDADDLGLSDASSGSISDSSLGGSRTVVSTGVMVTGT